MSGIAAAGGLIGGLVFLLVGRWLLTEGSRAVTGRLWKARLRHWTRDRRRCFDLGLAVALLLPSRSGVNKTALGLVRRGGLTPRESLWIVVGSGFGAVAAGWGVLAAGFVPELLALLLLLGGAALLVYRWRSGTELASWGRTILGAGVLLIGVHLLFFGASGLGVRLDAFEMAPLVRVVVGALAGVLLASLLTSASVTALVIVAAGSGALEASTAVSLLVGANVGTIVASLPTWRQSRGVARRAATGYLVFLGLGAFFGLLVFPFLARAGAFPADSRAAMCVALVGFQTFCATASALLLRVVDLPLTDFLQRHIDDDPEARTRSPRLDPHLAAVPELALDGVLEELEEIRATTLRLGRGVLGKDAATAGHRRHAAESIDGRIREVNRYLARLVRSKVPRRIGALLLEVAHGSRAYLDVGRRLSEFAGQSAERGAPLDGRLLARIQQVRFALLHLLQSCDPFRDDFSLADCHGERHAVEDHCHGVRTRLLVEGTTTDMPATVMEDLLEELVEVEEVARQAVEAAGHLARARGLGSTTEREGAEEEVAPAVAT